MISNPAVFFIDGNTTKEFTYELDDNVPSQLYHFSPKENGLSHTMENNIIFLANGEAHALEILKDLCIFAIKCKNKYIAAAENSVIYNKESYIASAEATKSTFAAYLSALHAKKVKLTLAPTNQIYIVGWASNDALH